VQVSKLSAIDLDLVVHGFAETLDQRYGATAVLAITMRGLVYLNESRQMTISSQQPHHSLGERLADHLRGKGLFTWENVVFYNPARGDNRERAYPLAWTECRPDVYACKPTLQGRTAAPEIYEIKVSRPDFLADIAKPEKRAAYAELAEAVYYVCQDGLISCEEVPPGYGLVCEVEPGTFELRRRAKRRRGMVLHADTAMTLMVKRQVPLRNPSAEDDEID